MHGGRKGDHVLFIVTYYPDGEEQHLDYAKSAAGKILEKLESTPEAEE